MFALSGRASVDERGRQPPSKAEIIRGIKGLIVGCEFVAPGFQETLARLLLNPGVEPGVHRGRGTALHVTGDRSDAIHLAGAVTCNGRSVDPGGGPNNRHWELADAAGKPFREPLAPERLRDGDGWDAWGNEVTTLNPIEANPRIWSPPISACSSDSMFDIEM